MPRRSRRVLICTTYDIISLFLWYCPVLYYILLHYYDAGADLSLNTYTVYTSGFLPYILLLTQAPILVWFDGTIIDISTILVTMYYCGYVGL